HGAKIVGLALSPNETTVATASWDRTVRLWDLSSGKPLHVLRGHTGPVNAVAFSSDGSLLLSAAYDGTLRLWSVVTGEPKRIAYRHGWGINVLQRFGATDQFLFGALDGTSAIYDLGTNTIIAKLKTHEKPVLSLAVLDQPGLIATGGGDGEIYVYRQGDWKLLESYRNPYGPVWAMAFADRGARLYFGSLDDFATAWQISPRKPFERVATKFPRRFQVNQNVSLGERQFARKCSICHTLKPDDANRAGPTLYKIFGRRAGSLPGYPYSKALKSIDVVWTAETIDKLFRLGPHDYTPGSKMPLQRIAEKAKRDALIEFLQAATQPESAN
ncbi:MAG: c-type cytochrome, partial [Hyphomicrobiaceae bacterium]